MSVTDPYKLEKLRACGRLETYSTARHHLGFYNNVSCTATYAISVSTVPIEDLIFRALAQVIARHPMLSAIPLQEEKSFPDVYFARLPSIDLGTCTEFITRKRIVKDDERDEELDEILQKQHNRNFKEDVGSRPFWRLLILFDQQNPTTFTAAWVFHHALADGTSGLVFHRSLLAALQTTSTSPSASEPIQQTVQSPKSDLVPAFEDLHSLPISMMFLIKALLGSIFPSWFDPRPAKLWTGGLMTSDAALLHAKCRSIILSPATLKSLQELSRKNKTTMTGTLQCIIASATLANLDSEKFERVKSAGPISMRRFMKWDGGSLENELVSGVTSYDYVHTRRTSPNEPSFSWDEARAVRAAIQEELDKKGSNSVTGLLKYVSDIQKFFKEKEGKDRPSTFEVSNIGVYQERPDTKSDEWRIGRVVFSQSPSVTGAAFAANVATGGDGCTVIAFTWYEGIIEGEMMVRIINSVEKEIDNLARAS